MANQPQYNGARPRRHRIIAWAIALVLIGVGVAWVAEHAPGPAPSEAVAVILPPPPPTPAVTPAPSVTPATPLAAITPSAQAPAVAPAAPAAAVTPSPAPSVTPAVPPAAITPSAPTPTAMPAVPLAAITPSAPTPTATPAAPPDVTPSPALANPAAQPAWQRFAAVAPAAGDQPRIAIVIDDLGLDRVRTARAIDLPAAVTMSFLAYSPDLPSQTAAARRSGHELLVHVPMEPINTHLDMGPNGLAVNQPRDEVLRRLRWDLDRFDGYVGINNHMGSRFTGNAQAMDWVLGELKARGLMFLDSRTIAASTGQKVAASEGVPYVARDVFLDDDQSAVAVQARLRDVEAVARKKGTAIAIGHPHDATLEALTNWIATLPRKGLVLVPLTDIVKARTKTS